MRRILRPKRARPSGLRSITPSDFEDRVRECNSPLTQSPQDPAGYHGSAARNWVDLAFRCGTTHRQKRSSERIYGPPPRRGNDRIRSSSSSAPGIWEWERWNRNGIRIYVIAETLPEPQPPKAQRKFFRNFCQTSQGLPVSFRQARVVLYLANLIFEGAGIVLTVVKVFLAEFLVIFTVFLAFARPFSAALRQSSTVRPDGSS